MEHRESQHITLAFFQNAGKNLVLLKINVMQGLKMYCDIL